MESDGAQLIAAMDGISPGPPPGTGPQSTSSSAVAQAAPPAPPAGAATPGAAGGSSGGAPAPAAAAPAPAASGPAPAAGTGSGSGSGASTGASPSPAPAPTTTTTSASITGVYNGSTVNLTPIASSSVLGVVAAGTLTDFQTNVTAYTCLNGASLNVYDNINGTPVAEAITPTDCIAQDFQLP